MATITLTTAGGEDAVIAADVGAMLGLGRSATLGEIKADIIATYRQKLKDFRAGRDAAIARNAAVDPTIT
jgi:hypothetical protein